MTVVPVQKLKNICGFCGSTYGRTSNFVEAAKDLGRILSEKKIHLINEGGDLALMGLVSLAANIGGSQVLGIFPKALAKANIIGKTNCKELIVTCMHERLITMIKHVDAFIALPAGLGTLEEIFTIASWAQLSIHQEPIELLDVNNYYGLLIIDRLEVYQPETNLLVYQLD